MDTIYKNKYTEACNYTTKFIYKRKIIFQNCYRFYSFKDKPNWILSNISKSIIFSKIKLNIPKEIKIAIPTMPYFIFSHGSFYEKDIPIFNLYAFIGYIKIDTLITFLEEYKHIFSLIYKKIVPISQEDLNKFEEIISQCNKMILNIPFKKGDYVKLLYGPFSNSIGKIINVKENKIEILINIENKNIIVTFFRDSLHLLKKI